MTIDQAKIDRMLAANRRWTDAWTTTTGSRTEQAEANDVWDEAYASLTADERTEYRQQRDAKDD